MTSLILDPYYTTDEGEVIDSFLVNSDGLILEYVRVQTEYGINISLAASVQLEYGYPGGNVPVTESLRDFVVTPDGSLHLYAGTFDPYLQSYNWQDPEQNNIQTHPGWSTANNGTYGGIDYYQDYIFVTDYRTYGVGDEPNGIVRFSQTGESTIRFADGKDFIDLTVGLDNLIYALESYGKVSVYNPETLELIRYFTLQEGHFNGYRGIAVNQQGEIFSAAWNDSIYYLDSQGIIVDVNEADTATFTTRSFYDINISPDGKELIASDRSGLVALLSIENQSLELQDLFPTGGNGAFVSFGAMATIDEVISPEVSISDAEVLEGDNESTWMDFTVSLSEASNETVVVNVQSDTYWIEENNVYPNNFGNYNDFFVTTETISFAPGETEKTFSVEIYGDLELEAEEQIFARVDSILSDNAVIVEDIGIGTIFDNEPKLMTGLILDPYYTTDEGEVIDSFLVNSDGLILEYVRIQTEYGINISLAASVQLEYGYPGDNVPVTESLRDFVVTPDGSLHLYAGTFDPYLQSYNWQDPEQNNIQTHPGWSTVNNVSFGGIDYYQDYIFVTDYRTYGAGDEENGIIRFSQTEEPAIRFADGKDFIDLTVGLDNLLYGLDSYSKVSVYNPETLELIRYFTLEDSNNNYRGIAVNQQGEIFSAAWDDNVYYFNPEGNIVDVNEADLGILETRDFYDINISPDGKELLASDRNGLVALLSIENQSLELQDIFPTGGNGAFVSFGAMATIDEVIVPVVSISNAEVLEGDNESAWMDFTVSLSEASNETVVVNVQSDTYWTEENDIYPDNFGNYNDFFATTETISFGPGETEKTFSVEIYGDLELETEERIFARVDSVLSDNAVIVEEFGIGTIFDNETNKPKLSISDGEAVEGTALEFTISLDQPLGDYLTVEAFTTTNYKIHYFDGRLTPTDAVEGEDYLGKLESFTFAPGETSKTFTVETIADSLVEGAEQFPVKIATDDTNVYLQDGYGIGIIPDNDLVIGEIGYVEDINHLERNIQFQNEYENPVIIISPLTRNGGDPAIARVTEVSSDSFSVFVQEPTLLRQQAHSGAHIKENFSYLVMEAGSWTMPDGSVLEVGLTEVDMNARESDWDRIEFDHDFDSPTVVSSVQTYNNDEFLRLRQRNGDNSGIDIALEKEEALLTTQYASETVGYIALEPAQNQLFEDGINYWAGNSGRNINHQWHELDTGDYPYLFASINSYYGPDSAGLRYQMGSIRIDEDTSLDNERGHTLEHVAYLGFDSLGSIVAEV